MLSKKVSLPLLNALCNKGWHFWKGGFVTDKTGLKIFVFINAMIFAFTTFVKNTPLYGKIASKVWKIYFQYISPHFLDAAGGQISDLWLLLLSNSSLFSALMSHLPLLLLHSALLTSSTMAKQIYIKKILNHSWHLLKNYNSEVLQISWLKNRKPTWSQFQHSQSSWKVRLTRKLTASM